MASLAARQFLFRQCSAIKPSLVFLCSSSKSHTVANKMASLDGVRVLELAGLAPVPFCSMMLADFGAQVIRIDRANDGDTSPLARDLKDLRLGRGKQSIAIDLKQPEGRELVLRMAAKSDVLVEPFRAGVMERLGLGPDVLLETNPRLIYARLTGYGPTGPLSTHAGHDINYLSYAGLLWAFGTPDSKPRPPINLLADFAGGGLLCSFAIVSALFQRSITGHGQVIDLNMTQGAAYVGSWLWRSRLSIPSFWPNLTEPGTNLLDGGRAFYGTYKTKDGGYVAVGSIEPRFFKALLEALEVEDPKSFKQFGDQKKLAEQLQAIFIKHDRKHWEEVARKNPNSCLSPVLSLEEAANFDHAKETKAFVRQPARLGSGLEPVPHPASMTVFGQGLEESPNDAVIGQDTRRILTSLLEMPDSEIDKLVEKKIVE